MIVCTHVDPNTRRPPAAGVRCALLATDQRSRTPFSYTIGGNKTHIFISSLNFRDLQRPGGEGKTEVVSCNFSRSSSLTLQVDGNKLHGGFRSFSIVLCNSVPNLGDTFHCLLVKGGGLSIHP